MNSLADALRDWPVRRFDSIGSGRVYPIGYTADDGALYDLTNNELLTSLAKTIQKLAAQLTNR